MHVDLVHSMGVLVHDEDDDDDAVVLLAACHTINYMYHSFHRRSSSFVVVTFQLA